MTLTSFTPSLISIFSLPSPLPRQPTAERNLPARAKQQAVARSLAPVALEAILRELAVDEGMAETDRERALELAGKLGRSAAGRRGSVKHEKE